MCQDWAPLVTVRLTSALQCVSQLGSGRSLSSKEDELLVKSLLQHKRASRPDGIASRSEKNQIATIKKNPENAVCISFRWVSAHMLQTLSAHSVFLATVNVLIHTVIAAIALYALNNLLSHCGFTPIRC